MKTGEKIKKLRMEKKWSQKKLAEMLEMDQGSLCNWEKGKRLPSYRIIGRLAEIFGVTQGEILGDDGAIGVKNADETERLSALNTAIMQKNKKIRELEDQILDLMQRIEDLEKIDAEKLQRENEKLKKLLFDRWLKEVLEVK